MATPTPTRRTRRAKPEQQQVEALKRVWVRSGPKSDDNEEDAFEEVEVLTFESEPAYVRVSSGVTRNLGNYESLRVDVSATVPCYPETMDSTFDETAQWVADRLSDEVDNYMGTSEE